MIEAIVGFNGSGKGQFTIRQIRDWITGSDFHIITNFAVLPEILAAYCKKHYPEKEIYIDERVTVLSSEQVKEFYSYLPLGYRVKWPSDDEWARKIRPDFKKAYRENFTLPLDESFTDEIESEKLPPCVFVIDEAWDSVAFEGMSNRNKGLIWFANQHRKFNCDIVFATPAVTDIDPKLRNLIRQTHVMRNMAEEKVFWIFRKPAAFVRTSYNGLPGGRQDGVVHPPFSLDLELSACYDTAAGVGGVVGRKGADSGRKKKGFHWSYLVIIGLLFFVGLWYSGDAGQKALFGFIGRDNPVSADSKTNNHVFVKKVTEVLEKPVGPAAVGPAAVEPESPRLYYRGFVRSGSKLTVFFSDGSSFDGRSPRISKIGLNDVFLDGRRIGVEAASLNPVPRNWQTSGKTLPAQSSHVSF